MTPDGLIAFSFRTENKSKIYSHEKESLPLEPIYEQQFKANKSAWEFFIKQAPSYKKVIIHWIMTAKQEKTRQSRLEKTIDKSEQQQKIQ